MAFINAPEWHDLEVKDVYDSDVTERPALRDDRALRAPRDDHEATFGVRW